MLHDHSVGIFKGLILVALILVLAGSLNGLSRMLEGSLASAAVRNGTPPQ